MQTAASGHSVEQTAAQGEKAVAETVAREVSRRGKGHAAQAGAGPTASLAESTAVSKKVTCAENPTTPVCARAASTSKPATTAARFGST